MLIKLFLSQWLQSMMEYDIMQREDLWSINMFNLSEKLKSKVKGFLQDYEANKQIVYAEGSSLETVLNCNNSCQGTCVLTFMGGGCETCSNACSSALATSK